MSPWIRLDDAIGDDPRLASVGATGAGVVVLALGFSNRYLSDGWAPAVVLRRPGAATTIEALDEAIAGLLQVGALTFVEREGVPGYQIHKAYVSLQPTAEQVRKQRGARSRQKAAVGRLGGVRSGEARRQQKASTLAAPAKQDGSTSEAPVPVLPDPQKNKSTDAAASASPSRLPREKDLVGHEWLMAYYASIVEAEPHSSAADLIARLKQEMARMHVAPESWPDAIRKAMDAVDTVRRKVSAATPRPRGDSGFRQVASR